MSKFVVLIDSSSFVGTCCWSIVVMGFFPLSKLQSLSYFVLSLLYVHWFAEYDIDGQLYFCCFSCIWLHRLVFSTTIVTKKTVNESCFNQLNIRFVWTLFFEKTFSMGQDNIFFSKTILYWTRKITERVPLLGIYQCSMVVSCIQ